MGTLKPLVYKLGAGVVDSAYSEARRGFSPQPVSYCYFVRGLGLSMLYLLPVSGFVEPWALIRGVANPALGEIPLWRWVFRALAPRMTCLAGYAD